MPSKHRAQTPVSEWGMGDQRYTPAALLPGKRERQYPLYKRLGGPGAGLGRCGKCCLTPRFAPPTVQPVASRYTGNGVNVIQIRGLEL